MPTWLWIVWAFFGACTFIFAAIVIAEEVAEGRRSRERDRALDEIAATHAERERAMRPIGRVPRDRSAAR